MIVVKSKYSLILFPYQNIECLLVVACLKQFYWKGYHLSFFNANKYYIHTGCSLNILVFPQNFVIFLNSACSAAALVFFLPGVCTHTDIEGKQRKARVRNILKSSKKHNISWTPCITKHFFDTLLLRLTRFQRLIGRF